MELKSIPLTDILVNENNIYDEQMIEELAESLRTYGQLENATVFENGNQVKPYTLVGGHRRFKALSSLAERGEGPGELLCSVVEKPCEVVKEKMLIVHDNQQRRKDRETKLREVQAANEYWMHLKRIGKQPKGKRRTWIAVQVGMSERSVQDLLSQIKASVSGGSGSSETDPGPASCPKSDPIRYLRNAIRNLDKALDSRELYDRCSRNDFEELREIRRRLGVIESSLRF